MTPWFNSWRLLKAGWRCSSGTASRGLALIFLVLFLHALEPARGVDRRGAPGGLLRRLPAHARTFRQREHDQPVRLHPHAGHRRGRRDRRRGECPAGYRARKARVRSGGGAGRPTGARAGGLRRLDHHGGVHAAVRPPRRLGGAHRDAPPDRPPGPRVLVESRPPGSCPTTWRTAASGCVRVRAWRVSGPPSSGVSRRSSAPSISPRSGSPSTIGAPPWPAASSGWRSPPASCAADGCPWTRPPPFDRDFVVVQVALPPGSSGRRDAKGGRADRGGGRPGSGRDRGGDRRADPREPRGARRGAAPFRAGRGARRGCGPRRAVRRPAQLGTPVGRGAALGAYPPDRGSAARGDPPASRQRGPSPS